MKRYFLILLMILLASMLSACSPATPVTTPTAGDFHSLTAQTGVEDIDIILGAVASGDVQMLRSLVGFTTAECTQQDGLGGPPKCRAGEVQGTPVEVLPSLGPEGSFIHKEEIGNWPGVTAAGLYAIYEVSPAVTYEQYYPAGKYAIMFLGKENQPAVSLRVDNGKIVRVDYLFDTSPEELNGWLEREASKVILAPVK